MKKNSTIIILSFQVLLLFFTGCAAVYDSRREQLLKTSEIQDYGPKPPENFLVLEKAYLEADLKDPDSAEFQFTDLPPKTDIIQSGFGSPKPLLVWTHIIEMNARNSYGGYAGYEPYEFAWRNGKIVAFLSPENGFWLYLK